MRALMVGCAAALLAAATASAQGAAPIRLNQVGVLPDGVKLAVPYRTVPALGLAIAFFTDPWGTYIELTEGLDKVP